MNPRIIAIVDTLLDLTEDLASRMPILRQHYPEYSEEQITQYAQADPTSPARASYITWLLRMLRNKAWDGTPEPVRGLLDRFDEVKNAPDFNGDKNIGSYTSIDALQQVITANAKAGTHRQKAKQGVEVIAKHADMTLFKLSTPEACRKFAIGRGTVTEPEARWCTIAIDTAASYLAIGPIYPITKAGHSYVQSFFGGAGKPGESKDQANHEITPEVGAEIAPLFTGPEFEQYWSTFNYRPTGWAVTDTNLEKQLNRLVKRWFNEKIKGFNHPRTGERIAPEAKGPRAARKSMLVNLPEFYKLFVDSIHTKDEGVIRQIGERHGSAGGLQGIFNALYEAAHPQAAMLPPLLATYETFRQKFEDIADEITRTDYARVVEEPEVEEPPAVEPPAVEEPPAVGPA